MSEIELLSLIEKLTARVAELERRQIDRDAESEDLSRQLKEMLDAG